MERQEIQNADKRENYRNENRLEQKIVLCIQLCPLERYLQA